MGLLTRARDLLGRLDEFQTELAEERARTADLAAAVDRMAADVSDVRAFLHQRAGPLLRAIAFEDADQRRRLDALRDDPAYETPWVSPEPLVSICISAIAERAEVLADRAIASALAQTHGAIEVIVVADGFDPATHPRLAPLAAERVRFGTVTQRMRHADPARHWLTAATLTRNEAQRMARGAWVTELDDDDALRPDAIADLLELARSTRAEVAYGLIQRHDPTGAGGEVLGGFPPEPIVDWGPPELPYWRGRASSAALVHAGLRFFARRDVAGDLGVPGDQFIVEQMVRAGVRFAHLDRVVYDYFPSSART